MIYNLFHLAFEKPYVATIPSSYCIEILVASKYWYVMFMGYATCNLVADYCYQHIIKKFHQMMYCYILFFTWINMWIGWELFEYSYLNYQFLAWLKDTLAPEILVQEYSHRALCKESHVCLEVLLASREITLVHLLFQKLNAESDTGESTLKTKNHVSWEVCTLKIWNGKLQ